MDRLPPLPDLHERRVNRPGLARTGSVAESSRTGYTQWTQYTSETATQDIHTMLALSHFPPPPTTIPSPTTPPTSQPPVSPPYAYGRRPPGSAKSATGTSSHTSHPSFSTNQEEILQDYFIASLLNGTGAFPRSERQPSPQRTDFPPTPTIVPASGRPSPDSRLRYVPTSPTLSAYTHRTSLPGPLSPPPLEPTPPLPPLPSPLIQAYFPSNAQHLPPPQTIESESSSSGNPSVAYTSASHGTTIVRVSSPPHGGLPPLPPTPGFTTVVGYARAEYLPKAMAVASPPPPIIIPVNRSSTNLIDLASPHPPERAQLSPRVSRFPSTPDIPEGTDTLAPLAGPSRFRLSTTPSPRTEAPPNVPEDVTSHDDHVPSTSYFSRDRFKHRISMSSIFSKFSRSTSISSKHGGRYARRGTKKDLPPLPKRPDDPKEIKQSEAEMALPALLNRAGFLSQLLETGRLPARNSTSIYHGVGSLQQPHTPGWGDTTPEPPSSFSGANSASVVPSDTPPNGTAEGAPWEYSSGSGYVDETAVRNRTSQSIRSFFTRGTTTDRSGHFNVLDEELQRRYLEEIAAQGRHSGDPSVGSGAPHVHPPSDPGSEKPRRITIVDRPPPSRSLRSIPPPWRWKKHTILAVLVNIALVFAVIATAVGLTWKKNSSGASSGSSSGSHCSGNFTGSQCNLDATCICTTPGALCNPLAKSISDALPSTNNAMKTNYTTQSVALTLWDMQGSPVGGNCAQQAVLLDINPSHADDTHLQWARSAVLWSALQSEDGAASAELREFVTALDYSKTDQSDSSSNQTTLATDQGSVGPFQKLSSGFLFDFAQMAVTAPSLTWRAAVAPSDAETGQVSESMESVLDRFYTSSNALSTQSSTPLQNYWVKDLNLDINLLSKFVTAVQSSPVLLPFDMTLGDNNKSLPSIMQLHDPKTVSFPPPLGCNPMMSASQLQVLNSIEQNAFKLPEVATVPSSFDFSCFASRPVYGVLDVLRLRLPFLDKTDQAPLQAAVLSADATSRALIRPGTVLSLFPSVDSADAPASAVRQRNYGTLKYLNHVLLAWLKSLPLAQASAIATFVANSSPTSGPPTSSALNATALASVPGIEVAVFGTIGPTDVDHSVSSFAATSGSLFFGSQTGGVFREWAANTATSTTSVVWADSSTSAKVVKETVTEDSTFEAVWQGASTMITNANVMGKVTGASDVATVVGVFEQIGYLGS